MEAFLISITTISVAEIGDRTQLLSLLLAARFRRPWPIIAGILYVAGAANSIHFMVGSVHKGHHLARAAVSFVVGIALLIIAWFASRTHR